MTIAIARSLLVAFVACRRPANAGLQFVIPYDGDFRLVPEWAMADLPRFVLFGFRHHTQLEFSAALR